MDSRLKQRLIGAAVLVALAVIFLPMLVQGPAPDSGVADVPLSMPDAPRGDYETRDLPLVTPGERPDGGVVGMGPAVSAPASAPAAVPDATSASQPLPTGNDTPAVAEALPASPSPSSPPAAAMFPAPTAGGDYAVSFGTYATAGAANAVVAPLRASQLPGYREAANVNGKSVWRVRIGPYASRADAEAARLRAAHVRDDVGARVIALDAPVAAAAPKPTTTVTAPATPAVAKPIAASATRAAADTGFAIQLAAYSKSGDAIALRDKLRAAGFTAFTESVSTDKGSLTRVRVGPVMTRADAEQLRARVKARLGLDGIVRPHP
jgi:cell division septation protein DedD